MFESRLLTAFFALCFVPFLVEAAGVYVANSEMARAMLGIAPEAALSGFARPQAFVGALSFQGALAFLLTAWIAPTLVSPDIVNGALPLYLSRPLSRGEYVLGKLTVLFALLSLVTWVPMLTLFGLQAGLAPGAWWSANLRVGWAILAGAWIWISLLALMGLALSAWIRWRLLASGALVGVFFLGAAFGEVWREVLRNPWGRLANVSYLIGVVWRDLFGIVGRRPLAHGSASDLPAWSAWLGLLGICGLCLWLLDRRLRGREVAA